MQATALPHKSFPSTYISTYPPFPSSRSPFPRVRHFHVSAVSRSRHHSSPLSENFKFSRLALQAALQSGPELCLVAWLVYRGLDPTGGPYVDIDAAILAQVATTPCGVVQLHKYAVAVCWYGMRLICKIVGAVNPRRPNPFVGKTPARCPGLASVKQQSNNGQISVQPGQTPVVQALVAHLVNVWDKALMFRGAARAAGSGGCRHALLTLALKGSSRVARPVLQENLNRWVHICKP